MSKYGEWTREQDEALLDKLGGIDVVLRLLTYDKVLVIFEVAESRATVTATKSARSVLKDRGVISCPERPEPFKPSEYFKTRSGLRVSDGFEERIVKTVKPVIKSSPAVELRLFDLMKNARDADIGAELLENHVFSATEACSILAHLIDQQKDGQDGPLLTNGYANILYIQGCSDGVFTIDVRWYGDDLGWDLLAYQLVDNHWLVGHRVVSRK